MLNLTITSLVEIIKHYGYIIVFPISVAEGPIVAVVSGFLISAGYFSAPIVFFILLAGDIVGDAIYYSLGRFSRHTFINKWGKYIGINETRIKKLDYHFERHDWKILLIGKTQPIGAAILFSAGMTKMPLKKFVWYNLLASAPKVIIFLLIGYYTGEAYTRATTYLDYIGFASFGVAVLLIVCYIVAVRYLRAKEPDLNDI